MDLFRRLPKFRPLPSEEQQLIPHAERGQYPALRKEFEILEKELMPSFREMDNEALEYQNWYRWMYVILIFGSALVAIVGIVQLVIDVAVVGIVGTLLATFLGIATYVAHTLRHHERYLNARLGAELLRSEYFLFLGRLEPYNHEQDRVQKLIERVTDIKIREEHSNVA